MKMGGRYKMLIALLVLIFSAGAAVVAQNNQRSEPRIVQVQAEDGLTLIGDFYAAQAQDEAEHPRPAVLLLHMLGSNRESWAPLMSALMDKNYHVLTVDLRGHGETGGEL